MNQSFSLEKTGLSDVYQLRAMKKPEEESWGDAPPQNSLSRRAAAAFYYCVSSIAVQFMNKVGPRMLFPVSQIEIHSSMCISIAQFLPIYLTVASHNPTKYSAVELFVPTANSY